MTRRPRLAVTSLLPVLVLLALGGLAHADVPLYNIYDLGTLLGGDESTGYGINASGQVTGQAYTAGGEYHAFLSSGGGMTDLATRLP